MSNDQILETLDDWVKSRPNSFALKKRAAVQAKERPEALKRYHAYYKYVRPK